MPADLNAVVSDEELLAAAVGAVKSYHLDHKHLAEWLTIKHVRDVVRALCLARRRERALREALEVIKSHERDGTAAQMVAHEALDATDSAKEER